MAYLLLLFIIIPIIEIYLLIEIGSSIGAPTTILIIICTAVIGAGLVRMQGVSTLMRAQSQIANAKVPAVEVMEGAALIVAGALLLTPGFFTDGIGFILLTPPLRRWLIKKLAARNPVVNQATQMGDGSIPPSSNQGRGNVIDVEHKEID